MAIFNLNETDLKNNCSCDFYVMLEFNGKVSDLHNGKNS